VKPPEEESDVPTEVQYARSRAATRLVCLTEGHLLDPDEADEYDQVPCLRCGQWTYVD